MKQVMFEKSIGELLEGERRMRNARLQERLEAEKSFEDMLRELEALEGINKRERERVLA